MSASVSMYTAFAGRSVKRVFRTPEVVISTAVFPLLLLLTLTAVFASAIEAFEGDDYAQRLVPGLVIGGIVFGSIGAAVAMGNDLRSGYMQRVRSMPVPATAPLVGAVVAEGVRALMALVVLVSAGYVLGFRFEAGVGRSIGFVVAAMAASMSLTWIGMAVAVKLPDPESIGALLNMAFLVFLFFSQGMVPLEAYPDWAHPIVHANPATAYVELLDNLARGGPLAQNSLVAGLWSVGLAAVCGSIAARSVRGPTRGRSAVVAAEV